MEPAPAYGSTSAHSSCSFIGSTVLANDALGKDTYRLQFRAPEIAARIVPGQFVMIRLAGCNDPLLGRPLAMYDTVCDSGRGAEARSPESEPPDCVEVVYRVMGKMTGRLATSAVGERIEVWGPLGNGFSALPTEHLIMVGGGVGHTPFLALGQAFLGIRRYGAAQHDRAPARVTFCYGERSTPYFSGLDRFRAAGIDVLLSTDDGSLGHHGRVTEVLEPLLAATSGNSRALGACRIACCGPEPMMHAVAQVAARYGVPCELSLETPMACGLGICFSCVAKVLQPDGGWDYRRTCIEGPIFDAQQIVF